MKHINHYRSTNSFCINGVHVKHMYTISMHFGWAAVNCVAHDPKIHETNEYTIRKTQRTENGDVVIEDLFIKVVAGRVEIVERAIITDTGAAKREIEEYKKKHAAR